MTAKELDAALTPCPLLQGLTPAERADLVRLLDVQEYTPGQAIVVEGPTQHCLWIVLEGRCEVVKCVKRGKEQILASVEPLGIIGEMSFFHPAPHSATVRAITPVKACRLTAEKFDTLRNNGSQCVHKLALNTVGIVAERLRRMDEWVCEFMERAGKSEFHEEWCEFQSKLYSGWKF